MNNVVYAYIVNYLFILLHKLELIQHIFTTRNHELHFIYILFQLIKNLPNLNEKNKERPLCYIYSIKARAIIHAHLSRIPLNPNTLEVDRRYIIGKCPYLINEQVNCVNQLIMLAYAKRSE